MRPHTSVVRFDIRMILLDPFTKSELWSDNVNDEETLNEREDHHVRVA